LPSYKRPRCRTTEEIEQKVVFLKERMPALTVRQARGLLEKEGIKLSLKGIWSIWRRYGYAGFKKENMTNEFIEYCPWTKEARYKFLQVKELMSTGKTMEAAKIINSIPLLPKNDILHQIPDNALNIKRKVEKISALFGKVPIYTYLKKVNILYNELRQKDLNYSALRTGITEVIALSWLGKPEMQLNKIIELKKLIYIMDEHYKGRGSYLLFEPKFTLTINEGISFAMLMNIDEAKKSADRARKSLKTIKSLPPIFCLIWVAYIHILRNIEKLNIIS